MVLALQFDWPLRVLLAIKFQKRRGTKDFLPQKLTEIAAQFPAALRGFQD